MKLKAYSSNRPAKCGICKQFIHAGYKRIQVIVRDRTVLVHPICIGDAIAKVMEHRDA